MKRLKKGQDEEDIHATCQFFDTRLDTSIAELFVHGDHLVCVTRTQVYLMNFNLEQQLQWRIVFDAERDLDAEGKLRKIRYSAEFASLYTCFYQNKAPRVMVRIDLDSAEGMYYTHKLPPEFLSFATDPGHANKVWVISMNQVEGILLKPRNDQLVENEFPGDQEREILIQGKGRFEGLTLSPSGEFYFVSEHNYIKKYSLSKHELIYTLEGHSFEVEKMVFSRDMRYLIR